MTLFQSKSLTACLIGLATALPVAASTLGAGVGIINSEEGPYQPPNPTPPSLPAVPGGVGISGTFRAYPDHNLVEGGIANGVSYTFGGGAGTPYSGQLLTLGNRESQVTLQAVLAPIASVLTTATQGNSYGRSAAGLTLGYRIELHADDQASADQISALVGSGGVLARISGMYQLSGDGYGYSSVAVSTGTDAAVPVGAAPSESLYQTCGRYGVMTLANTAGCGSGLFNLAVNFAPGSAFSNGDLLSFYSAVNLSVSSDAGTAGVGLNPVPGTSMAFIDPTITLANGIHATLVLGNGNNVSNLTSAVPEPAGWALLLTGLGGLAAMTRRRRGTGR